MCGIAGFCGMGTREDIERMTRAMRHRGPDGEGFFCDPESAVFLGHRRLAIIDVAGGQQPMWNEDGQVGIVFNGEIYNHAELREELIRAGHRFASAHSDTEVLVHGYEEWGRGLPERLNGMFAFAILDRRRRRLFLARDRFGEKPLFYFERGGLFAFASELGALARHRDFTGGIDELSVAKLLAWGYLPAPTAMLTGCRKLPGGHSLTFDLATRALDVSCYWRFRIEPDEDLAKKGEDHLVDELHALLAQAAQRRLMSDVPLGVYLSGGLDSSSILAVLAERRAPETLDTFTIGFTEASFDERSPARLVAGHIGARHHEEVLSIEAAKDLIEDIVVRLDEPLGDASIVPTALLARFARRHVTVALTGDGGDELLAGYDPFVALRPAALYAALMPDIVHRGLRGAVELLPASERNMSLDFKLKRTLMGLSAPEAARLPTWMAPLEIEDICDLVGRRYTAEDLYGEAMQLWQRDQGLARIDRALEFFTTFYLQDDILVKADRAAMLNSLEGRAVFLDSDLVDFCRRLPSRYKLRGNTRKYLLKRMARRLLPASIVDRPKKGFGIPLAAWLKSVPDQPPLAPILKLDAEWAERAWAEHRTGRRDNRLFLWTWLGLQGFSKMLSDATAIQLEQRS